jgi:type IX secretion system PorP/SprF family membrane protein
MKNIYITFALLFACGFGLFAQQDAQYTQYMFNTLSVNPAYAGSRDVFSVIALHRSQWVGLDGAPTTQTFNINTPVSERVGLGLSVVNDEIGNGTNSDTYFDGVFSYSVPTSDAGRLSFGVSVGGHLLNVDFNQLQNFQAGGTAVAPPNIDNRFEPNFGAGVYYNNQTFYVGLSVPNFLQTEHFDRSGEIGNSSLLAKEQMNLYLISGYVFELNSDWLFKPALLFKAVQGAPLQADISANFLVREKFSFGGAYRWSAAWSALAGFQLTDQLLMGLAYDRETTELGSSAFNNGSFEVFLRYELRTKYKRVLTPRFF